jgi:hypothetical protein
MRIRANLLFCNPILRRKVISRYIDEHPSLTKEQLAYAQAAAKFEVL